MCNDQLETIDNIISEYQTLAADQHQVPVITNRHIISSKPDLIVKEKETNIIIDVAIPNNFSIQSI